MRRDFALQSTAFGTKDITIGGRYPQCSLSNGQWGVALLTIPSNNLEIIFTRDGTTSYEGFDLSYEPLLKSNIYYNLQSQVTSTFELGLLLYGLNVNVKAL